MPAYLMKKMLEDLSFNFKYLLTSQFPSANGTLKLSSLHLYICWTVKTEFGEVSDGDRIKQFELTFHDSYIH